jgi:hypothetical protein
MHMLIVALALLMAGCASTGYAPPGMSADEEYRIRVMCINRGMAAAQHPNWLTETPLMAKTFTMNRCLTENGILGVR